MPYIERIERRTSNRLLYSSNNLWELHKKSEQRVSINSALSLLRISDNGRHAQLNFIDWHQLGCQRYNH